MLLNILPLQANAVFKGQLVMLTPTDKSAVQWLRLLDMVNLVLYKDLFINNMD